MQKLLLIPILFIMSCGYAPIDNSKPVIITDIGSSNLPNICHYYGLGNSYMSRSLTSDKFKFRDSCGKYQIGDIVKFN